MLSGLPAFAFRYTGVEKLFVLTSDYSVGSYSTLDLINWTTENSIGYVHSDAGAKYFKNKIYVINRLNSDNIEILNCSDLKKPILQFSTGPLTNPQHIAFISEKKAYITLYEETYLLVVNPSTGDEITQIDLSSYADDDGIPEMSPMVMLNGKLFVAIQRLDRDNWFAPTDKSYIVEIDADEDIVIRAIQSVSYTHLTLPTKRIV